MTKIVSLKKLFVIRYSLFADDKVVLVTGVFDLLHREHKHLLGAAKKQGTMLMVGLEPDQRVAQLKGEGRPVNNITQRLDAIAKLGIADYTFELPQNMATKAGREDLIKKLRPHILAVSPSTPNLPEKRRIMRLVGGRVKVVIPYDPTISTTSLLKQKSEY